MIRYADKYRARTICTPTTPEFCGGAAYAAATGNTDKATEEQLARKVIINKRDSIASATLTFVIRDDEWLFNLLLNS
jgi:hypothetical protein